MIEDVRRLTSQTTNKQRDVLIDDVNIVVFAQDNSQSNWSSTVEDQEYAEMTSGQDVRGARSHGVVEN